MSTTLTPPGGEVAADAVRGERFRRARRRRAVDGSLAGRVRFAAFAGLVVYGCAHWVRQVAPTQTGVGLQMAGVAIVLALALWSAGRGTTQARRRVVAGVLCGAGFLAALTAAGIPLRYVGWRNWGELASGMAGGLEALPSLNVPYRGLDEWVRWTMLSGAALLGVLAAALAFARTGDGARSPGPRRHIAAALALGTLYGVPVVERNPDSPFVSGAGFAVLLALFLGADRLAAVGGVRPRLIAVGSALAALGVAALVAPRLDGDAPWLDYRSLAGDLGKRNQTAFSWDHSYSPLDWPRDGREVLRVKARKPSYWKATVLRRFDGVRWVQVQNNAPDFIDTPRTIREWTQDIEVTVRGLRSDEYLTAGFASAPTGVPRAPEAAGSGTWRTGGRPLRTGDTYAATVYTPRPSSQQMRDGGSRYPLHVREDLTMELPRSVGGPVTGRPGRGDPEQTTVTFPLFGTQDPVETSVAGGLQLLGPEVLEDSGYARMWAAAQRLRAEATSPFDLVRSVRTRVQTDTRYTERPAQRPIPLEAFLFETGEGYCQQFSGAMALMLRMAGIPARVASGFTGGSYDSDRGQFIVRDLDAHSWVEAFFPQFGWVTFDPTPTVAPPAAQDPGDGGETAAGSEADVAGARADVPAPTAAAPGGPSAGDVAQDGGGPSPVAIAAGLLLLAALAAAAVLWRRPHTALSPLEELRRALARSGRPVAPELTLQGLERSLAGSPAAQGYVRKLRMARYAGREQATTPQERAALRDELAAGLGAGGRLRALWALPPRLPQRR